MNKKNHLGAKEREKNAKALLEYSECFPMYRSKMNAQQCVLSYQLQAFHLARFTLLQTGRRSEWFHLLRHYTMYKKIVSKKGMIADYLYYRKK